jgi:hypothetical protein
MRYLYGDSVPFPPQYDFLAALDVFCAQATRAVKFEAEARALRKAADEGAVKRGAEIDQLEAFHNEAIRALREGAEGTTQPLIPDYIRQIGELAQRIVMDTRVISADTSERERKQAAAVSEMRKGEVRDALEKVLIALRLPVAESHVTLRLIDGKNELSGKFLYRGGLIASFTLGEVDEWRLPRHVKDFAEKVTLPVGVKRSLFKRTLAPEPLVLDEYLIAGFDLQDDQAELRLRKKVDQPDSLIFKMKRLEDGLIAEVHHPDDAEAEEGLPPVLDQPSATEVERLWQLLRKACAPVLLRKRRLTGLLLEGADVFANDLSSTVIALIVQTIGGTVVEISRRSPNSKELSLKVESDDGRREEIYLRKDQLEVALASVPEPERAVFEPLGLIKDEVAVMLEHGIPSEPGPG